MAKTYVVIKNAKAVVSRWDSKQDAQADAESRRDANPRASYEFGKLDKRLYTTQADVVYTTGEETY